MVLLPLVGGLVLKTCLAPMEFHIKFDNIFNECSISSSSSKSSSSSNSLPKTSKKGKINVDKKAVNILKSAVVPESATIASVAGISKLCGLFCRS